VALNEEKEARYIRECANRKNLKEYYNKKISGVMFPSVVASAIGGI